MNNLKYWLAFSKFDFIGSVTIKRLYEHFGSMKEAWLSSGADLIEIEGITKDRIQRFLEAKKNINPDALLEEIQSKNIKVITMLDAEYPELLKQIHDPPAVLFIKGDADILTSERNIAVVGSRRASNYIKDLVGKIIGGLKGSDAVIVSGMAVGVDGCAHKSALENNLKTIAVLGSGFDWIYPKENKKLFQQIQENGAVVSEYYPDKEPITWRFPLRNRIISGLCKGTLIAEAGLKSGALITARLCLEQNRDLMCIPGLVTNPNTEGTHKLLKEGAAIVTCTQDIFNALNWDLVEVSAAQDKNLQIEMLDNDRKVYEILKLEPKKFDEILGESKMSVDELMITLTTLEINGIIKQIPGQTYTIAL